MFADCFLSLVSFFFPVLVLNYLILLYLISLIILVKNTNPLFIIQQWSM